jgi:polar amino acid transport system permease protein
MEKKKKRSDSAQGDQRYFRLPLWLDRLSARVARWPWWAIFIAIMIFTLFYAITTDRVYRDALISATDNATLITNRFTQVGYDVKDADGNIKAYDNVVVTSETATTVTLIVSDEARFTIPRANVLQQVCASPDASGECPTNQPVTIVPRIIEGALVDEQPGWYIVRSTRDEEIQVFKIAIGSQERIPERCARDPNGSCMIKVTLKPEDDRGHIKGVLLEKTAQDLLIQTKPPETVTIEKVNIVRVKNSVPAQCALNNIIACDEGIFLTVGVTFAAYALAVIIGLVFGLMRVSSNPVLFNISTVYVEVIRGVPLLVILLFAYFVVGPSFRDYFPGNAPTFSRITVIAGVAIILYILVTRWSRRHTDPAELIQPIVLTIVTVVVLLLVINHFISHSNLTDVQRGILGLAFGYGAFTAELFRAGIQSIGRGQMEAARSLGMSYFQAMRHVVLPQAFRVILPPLGNDFIALLKDSSLLAIIALPELTQKARLYGSKTFRTFEPYVTVGVLYLCMTLILSFMVRVVEHRTSLHK